MSSEVVFLLLSDVDRILRILYNGSRSTRIHFLICGCGRVAQLTQSDAEVIGWQILPHPRCPDCMAGEPYQGPARERYLELVDRLIGGTMFEDCAVEAESVEKFLEKYYRHDRYHGRGEDYAAVVLASHEKDFAEQGYTIISRHESVTGNVVAFFSDRQKKAG